ncbi:MAG: HD domain-containing protein [Amoebophilaceae bacterium]|jgi:Na+/proline symporter|nr:HD domain-containing protein [Amoebophilaceae bacterium]
MGGHSLPIDVVIFVVFLLINVVVGWKYRGRSQSFREYAVGDKKFSTATLTATIVATWTGGNILFNALERTYVTGLYYVIPSVLGDFVCLLVTGYVLGPRMGRFLNNVSVPESLGKLYGRHVQAIAGIGTVLGSVGYIAIQFRVIYRIVSIYWTVDSVHNVAGIVFGKEWLTIIVASVVILYATSGGVRAVTFTDVIQFLTFGTLFPVLALVVWSSLKEPSEQVVQLLTHHPNFSLQKVFRWSPALKESIVFMIYVVTPGLAPELFQRMAMARDLTQVKNTIGYAAIICQVVKLCIMWIAILLLADQPGLESSKLVQYMVSTYTYPGLRGFLCIGGIAMAMSTADSLLNSCAVIITNDILLPLKISQERSLHTTRWATVLLGCLSVVVALRVEDFLTILLGFSNFYTPIVVMPMLLAVFGFETSRRVVLMAMGAGAATAAACLLYFQSVDSFFPGMLVNLAAMMGAHYLLGEQGGWGHNPLPISYHTKPFSSQWKDWQQTIRRFRLTLYLEKRLPKQDQAYLLLAFYIFTTTYTSLYSLPKEVSLQYPSLYKGLYYSVTLVTTLFLAFPIWPQRLRAKRLLMWVWPSSIFYTLFFVGFMLTILSGFALPQLMLLMLNLVMTILFLSGPMAIVMFIAGSFLSILLFKQYTGLVSLPGSLSTLQFRFGYVLLLFSTSLIALFKHQQAYMGLEERNTLLQATQEETSQSLLQALQHREQLALEMREESTQLFHHVCEISEKLEQETKQLQDVQAIITARETLRKASTKLKSAATYFDQLIYKVKDHIRLRVSTVLLQELLQGAIKDLKRKKDPLYNTKIVVKQYTQQKELQCDVETVQQLLVDGMSYAQQYAQDTQPIFLSISDTTLGYPITTIQGYIKKVEALHITITSHHTRSIPLDLYMGEVTNTGLNVSKLNTILPLARNQRIVEEHYGATEFVEDTQGDTQIYIIPLRLREVRPATMDLPAMDISTSIASLRTRGHRQELEMLEMLKMYPEIDMATVKKAIQLIKEHHAGVKRKSGEPFYLHPIAVAQILLHYTQDQDTIIAALLHDTVEDTPLSLAQIGGMFNESVQHIVDGVTHLESNVKTQKRVSLSAHENIQKLLDVNDNRVLYVKLADRLHNMRTIEGHTSVDKQKKIASETLQFFVPIARYLRLHPLEKELKQLASQVMHKP